MDAAIRDRTDRTECIAPVIEARGLSFAYAGSPGAYVLKDLDLLVNRGECMAVLGESGSGKTTFLKLLCGLLRPLEGQLLFNGKPLTKPEEGIAMIFQNYGLFPWKTVEENVILPALIRRKRPEKKEIGELLSYLGLSLHAGKYPSELSGGQRQRTALGRAVMSKASLILMDEPFSALDIRNRERLQRFMKDFLRDMQMSAVIVTHSIEEAMIMGDRVAVFDPAAGNIREFFSGCREKEELGPADFETMQAIRKHLL